MDSAEELISESLDRLGTGFAVFDRELRLVACNRPFRQLRDLPEDLARPGTALAEILRFNAERGDFGPGDVAALVAERLAEIEVADERQIEREMPDGQILAIRYQHLAAGGLSVTFEDRTEEARARAALEISEERYALLAEAAEEGVYEWDIAKGRFFASPRLTALWGVGSDPSGQRDWRWDDRIHPEDLARYQSTLAAHLSGQAPLWTCEYRFRNQEGTYRWVADHGTSIRDGNGQALRMIAALRDITERVEKDAALAASEERHTLVTQATSDGLYDWNVAEDVLFVSDRLNQLFAFDSGELTSRIWAARVHHDDIGAYVAAIRAHFKGDTANMECEYRIRGKAGDYLWVRDHGIGVPGADGRVKRMVGAVRDITEIKAVNEALAEARDRFQDAIESLSSGLALFDAQDRVVVCNSKYREYFPGLLDMVTPGTAFRDILQAGVERGLFPLVEDDPQAFLEAIMARRAATSGYREQLLRGGLWLQISDHRTTDGGIVSIYTDISDLKAREEELRRQSALLEATLENMEQGISMVDPDLRVVMFNGKFLDFMQFPPERFERGFPMAQAFRFNAERGEYGEGDVERQVQERLVLSAKFLPHQFERTRQDGTVIEIVGNPIESGGFVTTYSDITERKQAEQVLRDREADLSAVLDTIEYGVVFMGPDLRARIINRAFGEIWGIPQDFIEGAPSMQALIEFNRDSGLYDVRPEDWDAYVKERVDTVQKGDVAPTELQRADGKVLQHQCLALPNGGRMLTYFDITDLKKRETELTVAKNAAEEALQELRRAQDRLVQAEKMASLGQLTAGISHEIKNPLNFVNNFARLSAELLGELKEGLADQIKALDDEAREEVEDIMGLLTDNLAKIRSHGQRADSIVKNMLSHSREDKGERRETDLNALAENAMNLAYHGARAEDSGFNVAIETDLDPKVGKIACSPQELTRVFLNLVANGIYAVKQRKSEETGDFEPKISLSTKASDGAVTVAVSDNGGGIPEAAMDKIFTPFFTTKPAGEGTGLGLSLSYDIVVKQHGGEMTVESGADWGTRISVRLPRDQTEQRS